MAKGRTIGRVEAALGLIGVIALGVTYSIITGWNPLPKLQGWLDHTRTTLAEPAPAWTVKVSDQPSAAVIAGDAVVVTTGSRVTGYAFSGGSELWTRDARWSAVAGSGASAVVVAAKNGPGYEAFDPTTGLVRWSDPAAIGAWTFTDLVIGFACPQLAVCVLTARAPGNGAVRWEVSLPGDIRPLAGANHALTGVKPLGHPDRAPQPVPRLLGFPVDDQVQVVDTRAGSRGRSYRSGPAAWVAVAASRVVVTSGNVKKGQCHLSVEGRDPSGDQQVWLRAGYDLHTGTALGCDQRNDPSGGGGLLAATSPDGHEVLLDPATGDEAYRAGTDERIIDTDGHLVLVRSADRGLVKAVDLGSGAVRWHRSTGRGVGVAIGPGVVVFTDPEANKLTSLSDTGQVLVDVSSGATVLGYASTGLVINIGRQVGLLRYSGAASR